MESASDLAEALAARAEPFCRAYLPDGTLQGDYWAVGDATGTPGQSMRVRLADRGGRSAGKWRDYATAEFGDLLDIIAHVKGLSDFADVASEARAFLGHPDAQRVEPSAKTPAIQQCDLQEKARRLLGTGKPIAGTPVEAYLKNRGIRRFGRALAWHPNVFYRAPRGSKMSPEPAMLASITDNAGRTTGVARTWLDVERRCVADLEDPKRVMGTLYGNAVRFGRRDSVLGCGEGLETMLSVGTVLPYLPLAACLTATHLGLFEIPDHVAEVWIFHDEDDAGRLSAARLARRARKSGRRVVIHGPVFNDFNDDLTDIGEEFIYGRMLHEIGPIVEAFARPGMVAA